MNNFSFRRSQLPPVTKNLIIINVLLWLVEFILPDFANNTLLPRLGLHPFGASNFNPVQPFTYMFLHDPRNPVHIFFNMFSLWMFGRILEQVWGSRRYLIFYLVCGVGAALVQEAVWGMTWRQEFISTIAPINGLTYNHAEQIVNAAIANHDTEILAAIAAMKNQMVTVGASGAIFGLLLGFAFVFPNMPMYLFFIPVPIKAKYMVLGYAVLEFFFGISGGGTIAHLAHLGGMLFGLIMILYWKKKGTLYQ
ncbi:MAG: rhomboid family intramembrane serine protease [Bacteroides sp.]|nr:rhomboid family intramembrane serine protease [Bacteroides sp.]